MRASPCRPPSSSPRSACRMHAPVGRSSIPTATLPRPSGGPTAWRIVGRLHPNPRPRSTSGRFPDVHLSRGRRRHGRPNVLRSRPARRRRRTDRDACRHAARRRGRHHRHGARAPGRRRAHRDARGQRALRRTRAPQSARGRRVDRSPADRRRTADEQRHDLDHARHPTHDDLGAGRLAVPRRLRARDDRRDVGRRRGDERLQPRRRQAARVRHRRARHRTGERHPDLHRHGVGRGPGARAPADRPDPRRRLRADEREGALRADRRVQHQRRGDRPRPARPRPTIATMRSTVSIESPGTASTA